MADSRPPDDTLLEFPCRFPIKVFGKNAADFEQIAVDLIRPHVAGLTVDDTSRNTSRGARYVAITIVIIAQSKAQLDAIYADLTASDDVLMAL